LFLGELPDGGRVQAVVTGDRDPGYGSTSKMIAESALCLVCDVQGEGGTWTPGALMGPALRKRLKERAGLTFSARLGSAQNCIGVGDPKRLLQRYRHGTKQTWRYGPL